MSQHILYFLVKGVASTNCVSAAAFCSYSMNFLHSLEDFKKLLQSFFAHRNQRPVFNFAPRGEILHPGDDVGLQGWSWPLGVKLASRGEVGPQGWSWPLGVKTLCSPLHSSKQWGCSPLGVNEGVNSPPRGHSSLWGPSSSLGENFTSRGKRMLLKQDSVF
jgi:hypothetical protein